MNWLGDLGPFWLSLRVASLASSLILVAGVPTAILLARGRFYGKGLLSGLLVLPLVIPPTVLGYAMLRLLGRQGFIGHWLEATWGVSVVFHWSGAVLASAVAAFPMFLLPRPVGDRRGRPRPGRCGATPRTGRSLGLLRRHRTPRLARARRRHRPGVRPSPGRLRRDLDGGREYPRTHPDRLVGHLRRRQRRRPRPSRSIVGLHSVGFDFGGVRRPEDPASSRAPELTTISDGLEVRLSHSVYPGRRMTKSRRVRSADRGLDPRIANDRTKFATEPTVPGADPTQSDSPGLSLDVNLRLGREIGILFGPSGSGKSTLLRLIAGLARPSSGMVRLDGSVLFDSSMGRNVRLRDRRVGMIFQDDLLFPHRSVAGNVRFGLHGWASRLAKERVAEVSELCGISGLLDRDPSTLSGGERQRVGLARALAPRPRLLLCDEPVSALDLDARHALIDRIGRVQRAESIPVLYVTHSPVEAIALGSRLFLLSGGRIAAEGEPDRCPRRAGRGRAVPPPEHVPGGDRAARPGGARDNPPDRRRPSDCCREDCPPGGNSLDSLHRGR